MLQASLDLGVNLDLTGAFLNDEASGGDGGAAFMSSTLDAMVSNGDIDGCVITLGLNLDLIKSSLDNAMGSPNNLPIEVINAGINLMADLKNSTTPVEDYSLLNCK